MVDSDVAAAATAFQRSNAQFGNLYWSVAVSLKSGGPLTGRRAGTLVCIEKMCRLDCIRYTS